MPEIEQKFPHGLFFFFLTKHPESPQKIEKVYEYTEKILAPDQRYLYLNPELSPLY